MKPARIKDLSPFFEDRCWMFVLLARQANVGVILRRGPTKWFHVTLWDTQKDAFEGGQWFRGRIYPERCDVSPNGKLFLYFAGKFRQRDVGRGYHRTWTAVSRPPYLTALALWPIGDTWGGGGVFLDDRTVLISTSAPSLGARNHPDHPPGPLRVLEYCGLKKGDPRRDVAPCWQSNWQLCSNAWRKTCGDLTLEREASFAGAYESPYPSRRRSLYTLYRPDEEPVALFEAHWADWDQQGRLVATVGGRVLTGELKKNNKLVWRQLAAMNEEQLTRMEASSWAQRW